MSCTTEQLMDVFASAAKAAGMATWGLGKPENYNLMMENEVERLEFVSGFKPTLLLGFGEPYPLEGKDLLQVHSSDLPVGLISPMAWGHDYHKTLHSKAAHFLKELERQIDIKASKVCVDTTPLKDRVAAEICGLGQRGRNGFVINPYLGTAWNIGIILIEGPQLQEWVDGLPVFEAVKECRITYPLCQSCMICKKACPTAAIREDGGIEVNKCLSAITQKKGDLSESEMIAMGNRLYGCDICQTVCPSNHQVAQFVSGSEVNLLNLLTMTKSTYREAYQDSGFYWRGLSVMKRNALVALGNMTSGSSIPKSIEAEGILFRLNCEEESYVLNQNLRTFAERWLQKNQSNSPHITDK